MLNPPKACRWALGALLLVLGGCSRDLVTGKRIYNWYGLDDDIKLGQRVMQDQLAELKKKRKPTDADPVMTQRVRKITRAIAAVSHLPNFPYEAHYADLEVVNAWCAPGGKVMVYSGLFDSKKGLVQKGNDDELAAVLGHE